MGSLMEARRRILLSSPHSVTIQNADIATFSTDMRSPLRSLRIGIDPVQDLHGYDSPWPAGGGKNKLAPAFSAGTTKTVNDVNFLFNSDGTVSVSGTCNGANAWQDVASYFSLPAGTYTLSGGAANGIYLSLRDNSNTALATSRPEPETFTISETTTVRVRACVLANTVVPSNTVLRPMLELGSTPTTYAPYSNLCPISGWSEANVTRCGKNLTPYSNRGNTTRLWGTSWVNQLALIKTLRPGQYTISAKFTILTNPNNEATVQMGMMLRWIDSDGTWHQIIPYQLQTVAATVGAVYDYSKTFALTDADLAANLEFYLYCGTGTTATTANCYDCQIELGSTATAYAPYTGNEYTIQLGDTVYGGTLDVLTGVLTVDRAMEQFQWGDYAATDDLTVTTRRRFTISDVAVYPASSNTRPYCNVAKWAENYNLDTVHFYVNNIKQALVFLPIGTADSTTIQLCYPLATPIEIPLTATQISTLAGQNVVWADCGEVELLKYWTLDAPHG